jgi:ketosteroid isomerase-like protein
MNHIVNEISRKNKINQLLIVLLLISLFSCTNTVNQNPGRDSNSDLQLCTDLWQSYADVLKTGNPDSIGAKFTDDAMIVYPEIPDIKGKENIQNLLNNTFPNIKMQGFDFSIEKFSVADSTVFCFIKLKEKYLNAENAVMNSDARISTLWKLGTDDNWRISLFQVNYKKENH